MSVHAILALVAGAAIAAQASLNALLGRWLQSPLLATLVAFGAGFLFVLLTMLPTGSLPPRELGLAAVPRHSWIAGGVLGGCALLSFYWLIPRMGLAPMLTSALSGRLAMAMIARHFGWFGLPVVPLSATKLVGSVALLLGIALINMG